jgi:hypothetical protein
MIIDSTFTNEGPGFVIRPPRTTSSTIELNIVYTREECFYFFAEPRVCGVFYLYKTPGLCSGHLVLFPRQSLPTKVQIIHCGEGEPWPWYPYRRFPSYMFASQVCLHTTLSSWSREMCTGHLHCRVCCWSFMSTHCAYSMTRVTRPVATVLPPSRMLKR